MSTGNGRCGSGDPRHEVLSRLKGVKPGRNGHDWSALCPAHEDRKASLSVSVTEDGTILMKCHSGCNVKAIVGAIGLTMADLFPDIGPRTTRGTIVKTYDYQDEAGHLLYQVVRFDPKNFRQRRPDGKGGWLWKLGDVRRVPYRLPEIITAPRDQTVFVVEGEKDADRLAEENILATTCAMGAGKWRPEYNEVLAGRPVVILPDNDEPGREHAAQVELSLRGVAASVKVVELPGLPAKGDVSDWLGNGGTASRLWGLIEATPALGTDEPPAEPPEDKPSSVDDSQAEDVAEAVDDPHRLSRLFLADHSTKDGRALHYWREEWYDWTGSAYRIMPEKEVKARLCQRIKQEFDRLNKAAIREWEEAGKVDEKGNEVPKPLARKVTTRLTTDVQHALASLAILPSTLTTPIWLGEPSSGRRSQQATCWPAATPWCTCPALRTVRITGLTRRRVSSRPTPSTTIATREPSNPVPGSTSSISYGPTIRRPCWRCRSGSVTASCQTQASKKS